jgi:predicted double-glycine peptidase
LWTSSTSYNPKNLGIYSTEGELSKLAGTDETGTSLYGLKIAAQSKGLTAIAAFLTIEQLQPNYLIVLNIGGTNHLKLFAI